MVFAVPEETRTLELRKTIGDSAETCARQTPNFKNANAAMIFAICAGTEPKIKCLGRTACVVFGGF